MRRRGKWRGWLTSTVINDDAGPADEVDIPRDLIPGYELERVIGRGAMGVVYRASRLATQEQVALKVIAPDRNSSAQSLQLFAREASVLSQLQHPGIVRFQEFGLVGGRLFLAMEYVETVSIERVVEHRTPEQQTRIYCRIICQILRALVHAHSRSLVHRDIKPANILVSESDGRLKAQLADFGLAKNCEHAGFSGITQEGQQRGTIAFMPPEQVRDSRSVKPPADIYSTGATLYHYLTGAYPFERSSAQEMLKKIVQEDAVPLSRRRPDLPQTLVDIIHRALARDPADRFASARQMGKALLPFSRRA